MRTQLFLAASAIAGLIATVVTVAHSTDSVYAIPQWAVIATVILGAVLPAGAWLALGSGQPRLAALVFAACLLAVLGILALLSIGILFLAAAVAVGTSAGVRKTPPIGRGQAIGGGLLMGVALPILIVFALSDPVVDCASGSSGENIFMGLSSLGGSGTSEGSATDTPNGASSGSAKGDSYEYSFACTGEDLTAFELHWR